MLKKKSSRAQGSLSLTTEVQGSLTKLSMATGRKEFRIHSLLSPAKILARQTIHGGLQERIPLPCDQECLLPLLQAQVPQRAALSQHTHTWHCRSYSCTISAKRSLCFRNSGLWASPCSSCTRKHFSARKSSPNGESKALLNRWGHGATPIHSSEGSLRGPSPVGWVRKRRKNVLFHM